MAAGVLKLNPQNTGLLVIDVQNDFCHERGAFGQIGVPLHMIQTMVPRLVSFIAEARQAAVRVLFVRTEHSEWTNSDSWLTQRERLRRRSGKEALVCVQGSWGADFYQVNPTPADRVVVKHRYSAFAGTDLDLILRSLKISHLLLTGATTNVCVESTARDAFMRDYYPILVEDCCAAPSAGEHEGTLVNMEKYFGEVASARSVLAALRGDSAGPPE